MPKIVKNFEFTRNSVGRSKYDWDLILGGEQVFMERDTDYTCKDDALIMSAREHGKKLGLKVKAQKTGDGVVLQAYPDSVTVALTEQAAPTQPKTKKGKVNA